MNFVYPVSCLQWATLNIKMENSTTSLTLTNALSEKNA